jgi:hypothetical protein
MMESRNLIKNPKKTEISVNKLATPPTRERAKRADQHVFASARNIKQTKHFMTLKTQKKRGGGFQDELFASRTFVSKRSLY